MFFLALCLAAFFMGESPGVLAFFFSIMDLSSLKFTKADDYIFHSDLYHIFNIIYYRRQYKYTFILRKMMKIVYL